MNIWIVTTGSSDVQIKTDDYWDDWYERSPVQRECDNLQFKPTKIIEDSDEPYRVPPRVLGKVYQQQPEEVWQCLEFPLLRQFTIQLQGKHIDKIILLLTDQTNTFDEDKREDRRCPYWQDTCELQDIIKRYFEEQDEFRDVELIPIVLPTAKSKPGLDDWNQVLKIVRTEFSKIKSEPKTVYVSHQAGTPAISSAVQFCSLARFGDGVKFLVSNEYEKKSLDPIDSSEYLKGIKFKQAEELLKRHDYAGVKSLVNNYLDSETKILLDAAIKWNLAKFDEFATELLNHQNSHLVKEVQERKKDDNWWWSAYETAYLGVIRLEQENSTEAFFHSFRSVEGLISKWAESCFSEYVEPNNDTPLLKSSILNVFPNYLGKKDKADLKAEFEKKGTLILSGFPLYALLRADRTNWEQECKDLTIFIEKITPQRNKLFHRLKGLEEEEVFKEWQVYDPKDWETRILHYLNFVARQKFISLKESSLMSQVHEMLKHAIAQSEHTP